MRDIAKILLLILCPLAVTLPLSAAENAPLLSSTEKAMSEKSLRERLIEISLEWEKRYGVLPRITPSVSEYDAAMLVGLLDQEYSDFMQGETAVKKGFDFEFNGKRYQIKGTRPSGKEGSNVVSVPNAKNYKWDILIWVNYDKYYNMVEAWEWSVEDYRDAFESHKGTTISAKKLRKGRQIYP